MIKLFMDFAASDIGYLTVLAMVFWLGYVAVRNDGLEGEN